MESKLRSFFFQIHYLSVRFNFFCPQFELLAVAVLYWFSLLGFPALVCGWELEMEWTPAGEKTAISLSLKDWTPPCHTGGCRQSGPLAVLWWLLATSLRLPRIRFGPTLFLSTKVRESPFSTIQCPASILFHLSPEFLTFKNFFWCLSRVIGFGNLTKFCVLARLINTEVHRKSGAVVLWRHVQTHWSRKQGTNHLHLGKVSILKMTTHFHPSIN